MNQEQLLITKKAQIFADEFNAFLLDSNLNYNLVPIKQSIINNDNEFKRCITYVIYYWNNYDDYYVNVDYEYNKNQFRFLINNYKKHHRYAIYNTDDMINLIKKDFNL